MSATAPDAPRREPSGTELPRPVISDGLPSQCSDTRFALRRHFGVDAESVVAVTLGELAATGHVKPEAVGEAVRRYRLDDDTYYPSGVSAGGDA